MWQCPRESIIYLASYITRATQFMIILCLRERLFIPSTPSHRLSVPSVNGCLSLHGNNPAHTTHPLSPPLSLCDWRIRWVVPGWEWGCYSHHALLHPVVRNQACGCAHSEDLRRGGMATVSSHKPSRSLCQGESPFLVHNVGSVSVQPQMDPCRGALQLKQIHV